MSANPSIIEIRNLTRRFGTLTAVEHLTLVIPQGEIFGLVGPDGAGKTTTLRMLCGLLDASEGQAVVAGHDVSKNVDAVKAAADPSLGCAWDKPHSKISRRNGLRWRVASWRQRGE